MLCRKCHYGCLGDHAGNGANRCARSQDSVGKQRVECGGLDVDRRISKVRCNIVHVNEEFKLISCNTQRE